MKQSFSIFKRTTFLALALIIGLGIVFIAITYIAVNNFHEASMQHLNREVAAHIVKFTSPYTKNGFDARQARSVFHQAMVLSPSIEVYFLDQSGKVLAFDSTKNPIIRWSIPLAPIKEYLAKNGEGYIKGPDPRDPDVEKVFSAAEVFAGEKLLGYIYVILGSSAHRSTVKSLLSNHILTLSAITIIVAIFISVAIALFYLYRAQHRFGVMLKTINEFKNGNYQARFNIRSPAELAEITSGFNQLADLLVKKIEQVKQAEEERKSFVGGISHDLRTPLSIARGFAETLQLKAGALNEAEQRDYVDLVVNKMRQVESMVNQLHELSIMESASFALHREPFIFSEVLQEVVSAFRIKAAEKNITLDCILCECDQMIFADVNLIERLVQNLIANAVAHGFEGSSVTAGLQKEDQLLVFHLANSGKPLDENIRSWLNSNNNSIIYRQNGKNRHIGLTVVKRIVSLHEFKLSAESVDNVNNIRIWMPIYNPSQRSSNA